VNRILYRCDNCWVFYDNRKRAIRCHQGIITTFDVTMFKRISCVGSAKHFFTNRETGERLNYCYYCQKKKETIEKKVFKNDQRRS
jgi:hypothetical protein